MISPAYCRGCDFWRDVASYTGCYQVCHYSMDTGTTRTRLGQLDVCQVRQVGGVKKARAKAHKYDVTRKPKAGVRYMELYRNGLTDRQISETIGATVSAVGNWRQRNKLPPNKTVKPVKIPGEKTGDPCLRCYSAEVCKRVGGTCNEKERYKSESTI